jgi:hypothetical protein
MREEELTPELIAAKTSERLKGSALSLDNVRSLGISFEQGCIYALAEVRCSFWLWRRNDETRGIELLFSTDERRNIVAVEGNYVYGKSHQ